MTTIANFDPNLSEIAIRFKELMKLKGVNSKQLAEILGISTPTLSNIINAKSLIAADVLLKASKIFNVTTDYILTGDDKITDNLLYRHQEISQEISDRIKDVESTYHNTELSQLLNDVQNHNKTSIKDLIKVAIEILKGGDEATIHNLINSLDDQTYDLMRQINIEFFDSISKRTRTRTENEGK